MPYPGRGNEASVGVVVPDAYREAWTIIREPDRRGLLKAITASGGLVDLCHYDSDKSWWGAIMLFLCCGMRFVPVVSLSQMTSRTTSSFLSSPRRKRSLLA